MYQFPLFDTNGILLHNKSPKFNSVIFRFCLIFLLISNIGVYGLSAKNLSDLDIAPCATNCEIQTKGQVHIGVDPATCEAIITPSIVGIGIEPLCNSYYSVRLLDEYGNELPSNIVTAEYIGQNITVEITEPECGNKGWTYALIEDKVAPTITCTDVTISCNGVGNIPNPNVGDDCQNTEFVLIDEIHSNVDCDDDYIGMILRTYIGRDSGGNESEPCIQTIMLERVTVGVIDPPSSFLFPNDNLSCGAGFATDENGNPHISVTGVPSTGTDNYVETLAAFSYIDISTIGNRVVVGNEEATVVVLGNDFSLYGMTFTSLAVSENGYITTDLADNGPDLTNDCPLPSDPDSPINITGARIYPLHDDLEADISVDPNAGVFYEYFALSPVLTPNGVSTGVSIFQWKVDHFSALGTADLDFQALLFDNGEITFQYNTVGVEIGSGATVGIQSNAMENNMAPINGTTISCDEVGSVTAASAIGMIPPDGRVDLFPFDNSIFCNGYSTYEDQILLDDGCTKKIMRKFTIGEWHCSSTNEVEIFQMIDIVDGQAPTVTAPNDMTVSTATLNCSASVALPAAAVADDCNAVTVDIAYPDGFIDNQNGGLAVLPVGVHIVTYTVYDACGNSSDDTMSVTVADQTDPIALCDGTVVVSIGTGNLAWLTATAFDDGSFDECGSVTYAIARMDDPNFNTGTAFGPNAEFDCSDIGAEIMVALLVTDMGGNTNMCMGQVTIQDKIDAFISCPSDITVDCTTAYDLDNLNSFGVPIITDNCTDTEYEETVVADFNQCGVGTIIRTFILQDNGSRECTQTITFENQNAPFGLANIVWPKDYTAPNGCTEANLSPAALDLIDSDFGFPIIDDMSTCILTGDSFTDEEFIGGGGACRTIYRTWKIIDWCSAAADGSFPVFEYIQTIEINNVTAPSFVSSTETIVVESYAVDCIAPVPVEGLVALATDDCTPDADLSYTYIIDLDNDGTNDLTGVGPNANATYRLGTHSVRYTVTDGCGNVAFQERLFTIVNLKTATAYCLDNISVNLIPMDLDNDGVIDGNMAMVTPDMVDAGSFHSCGYDIQLSFSADVNDTQLAFDCSTLGEQEIELWVTDSNGNADYCTTTIEVQDNLDLCSDPCDLSSSLILNAGFEELANGIEPNGSGQLDRAANWFQATEATSDYYDAEGYLSRGTDIINTRPPNSGSHFVGAWFIPGYTGSGNPTVRNYVEYIGGELSTPITAGEPHFMTFLAGAPASNLSIPPILEGEIVLLGLPDNTVFPIVGDSCKQNLYDIIATIDLSVAESEWTRITTTFQTTQNYSKIMFGLSCNNDIVGGNRQYLLLDDININSGDPCEDIIDMVGVSGRIITEDSEEIEGVHVSLEGVDEIFDMTEDSGEYAFPDMPIGGDYMVRPFKNDDHNNGVSTLDLVLVQRHILGLGDLDSPYKMIAADVNYNQGISAADIVILRKVILGVYPEFPSNNSWRFIDAEFNFADPANPWLDNLPEDYEITTLNSDMDIDFVGVKTGDVNESVSANAESINTETRNDNTWTLSIDDNQVGVGEIVTVVIKSVDASKVFGWQYSLETNDLDLVSIAPAKANISTQNINNDKGRIHMSYGEANGLEVLAEDVLYTITFQAKKAGRLSEMLSISDRGIRSESYHDNMSISDIEIRWNEMTLEPELAEAFYVAQNEPNPWYDRTTVGYYIPEGGDVRFVVKDVSGRTLLSTSAYREKGKHTQAIESRFLESNGVLLYELHYDDQIITNKMIHMK